MNKRQRVEAAFHNQEADHVPVCMWWHYDGSMPLEEMVEAHLQFLKDTDVDMLKISCDGFFGWPAEALKEPYDVKKLYEIEHISLDHPYMEGQIRRVRMITDALAGKVVTIYTTFCPLSLIRLQVGWDQMMQWMKEDPKAVMHACDVIADDTMALYQTLLEKCGVDGFMYSVQNAEVTRFSVEEYREWVSPSERKVLDFLAARTEYLALHCCGWDADELGTHNHTESWKDYPGNIIGWASCTDTMNACEASEYYGGRPVWGGFDNRKGCLIQTGSKEEIQAETKRLIRERGKKGFMLGPDCSLQKMEPERIRWVVEASREI